MKKIMLLLVMLISANFAHAQAMEQCRVLDADGNGLIKAYMADSGPNLVGDSSAWIWVPWGQCAKINAGDYDGVDQSILDKIQKSNITRPNTLD